ncbi:MAG: hypothetical protein A2W23_06005 [Planctomycetes bacterium RBG_16_43_13]|nr:MAG: hypothetical protein A2W23_06005 [Planctomycetes bacterium RBG_16_43_13]
MEKILNARLLATIVWAIVLSIGVLYMLGKLDMDARQWVTWAVFTLISLLASVLAFDKKTTK